MIVDAHQHFWDPVRADYPWMTDDIAAIRRRFGPEDLEPLLHANGVDETIVVQARHSLDETRELLELAAVTPFIRGVVGWIDLTDSNVGDVLAELGGRLVGVRHQVHDEPDPNWLVRPDVRRGLAAVGEAGIVYDLLVRRRELSGAIETVRALPQVRFVVDHLAKPPVRDGWSDTWAAGLAALAELPNVSCKLSGLVTEAGPGQELVPYLRLALDLFGAERCMFGSDWPVCLLAAQYDEVLALVRDALREEERAAVLGGTAVRVYA